MKTVLQIGCVTLLLYGSPCFASPIEILGLSWAQKPAEMKEVLEANGYECDLKPSLLGKGQDIKCSVGRKEISVRNGSITYNCWSFNGCEHSIQEIAQGLANKFAIEFEYLETHHAKAFFRSKRYKGRAPSGEVLEVSRSYFGKAIKLDKGSFGGEGLKF